MHRIAASSRLPLGLIMALAAVLRFATLDAKGFWEDEGETALIIQHDFGGMLDAIREIGTTPPLYYVLLRFWSKVFGTGEVGLRSLSALAGLAVVLVAYLIGKELLSRRAGLAAAALAAVNPMLVWYSQEARSYSLLVLTTGLALLFFTRALREPTRRNLGLWALMSSIGVATHYFGIFPFVVEAAWLVIARGARRQLLLAIGAVGVVLAVLFPYLLTHEERVGAGSWVSHLGLGSRLVQIPAIFLVGFESPRPYLTAALGAAFAGTGLWLLWRRGLPGEQRAALLIGGIGLATVAIPVVLVLLGRDYLDVKNVIPALVPLVVVLAAGMTGARTGRLGRAALVGLCLLSVVTVLDTAWLPKYGGRDDWRSAAKAIGPARTPRVLVVTPSGGAEPLAYYLPGTGPLTRPLRVREIDLVVLPHRPLGKVTRPRLPRFDPSRPAPAPGFRLVGQRRGKHFELLAYRSARSRLVQGDELRAALLDKPDGGVYVQPPS